jgi:hypothetical protein
MHFRDPNRSLKKKAIQILKSARSGDSLEKQFRTLVPLDLKM